MDKTIDNDLFLPLLFGLAKKGSIENLNYVIRHYMQSKFFIEPNIDAYNAIISGWVFRKDMYRANKVLVDIFGNNLMPTELTYERMIQGYTFQNDVDTAYRYLDALLELQDGNVRTIDQDGNAESITRFYNKPTVHASSQRTLHPRIMNYFFNMHLRKNDIERLKEAIIRFKTLNVDFDDEISIEHDQSSEDIDSAMLLKALGIPEPEFVVAITIAGEILEQNADEVRGSTLIWNFNILDPQPGFEPYAVVDTTVSSSGSSGTSGGLIALIIIAALASLTLLGVLQKRFATKKDATETDSL